MPKAGEPVDKSLSQVGRTMKQLGVQMIAAYSQQARPIREELRDVARPTATGTSDSWDHRLEEANRFLREHYIAAFNDRFKVKAPAPHSGAAAGRI